MSMFVLQVLIIIAVAFGLGCLFGCWLKGRMRSGVTVSQTGADTADSRQQGVKPAAAADAAPAKKADDDPHAAPQSAPASPAEAAKIADTEARPAAPADTARKPGRSGTARRASGKTTTSKTSSRKPAAAAGSARTGRKAEAPRPAQTKTEPAAASRPKPAKSKPVAADVPDNLKQIKGIGPVIEAKLNAAGINSFAQIASWTKKQQAEFAEQLSFAGRIEREEWVSQAKVLAKGGSTEFSKRVAKGEVASSAGKAGPRSRKT